MNAIWAWLGAVGNRWRLAGVLVYGALWFGLCRQLSVEWEVNPQYSYGWGVPLLALYLLWQRWADRPNPAPAPSLREQAILTIVLCTALLPVRLVQEANPDWRLVSWALALLVVGLSFLAVGALGGNAWMKHFGLAIGFVILAVPWPTPVETALTQVLMQGVAAFTVECANWCGTAATRSGNLIQLSNGVVGVNEACSGVRSLQATLMVSIFLGELYRFRLVRRLLLVLIGLLLALALNVARALLLTWKTATGGTEAVTHWHDPAGYVILVVAFAALWGIAAWLRLREPGRLGAGTANVPSRTLPVAWLAGTAVWLVVVESFTEGWYLLRETRAGDRLTWRIKWPLDDPGFRFEKVPEETRRLLRYSTGQAALWNRPPQGPWFLYWFRWNPGRAAAQLARAHSPEICLPASGLKLVSFVGARPIQAGGISLPFRVYVFDYRGEPMVVFFCLWEDRPAASESSSNDELLSRRSRFRAALEGRRHLGQVMFEVAMVGTSDSAKAEKDLATFLGKALITQ